MIAMSDHAVASTATTGSHRPAPGKATRTQRLPAPRAVASFDVFEDDSDTRATLDGLDVVGNGRQLTESQLRRAQRLNPRWIDRTGIAPHVLSNEPVDSEGFAADVAVKQSRNGLKVDGIAGPKTIAAVVGDDPFGLHLLASKVES